MARPRLVALAAYALALIAFAAFVAVPYLTRKRDIPTEVPSPPGLVTTDLVVLKHGERTCMTDIVLAARTRDMRFQVGTYMRRGSELGVAVRAAGYAHAATVPAGYPDNAVISVALPKPPRDELATVCLRNRGERTVALYAASDSARSRARVFVNGQPRNPTPTLSFHEARRVSLADRAQVTAERMAVFRGFLDHAWIVWVLAVAVLVVVPVLAGLGLVLSGRQPRSDFSGE